MHWAVQAAFWRTTRYGLLHGGVLSLLHQSTAHRQGAAETKNASFDWKTLTEDVLQWLRTGQPCDMAALQSLLAAGLLDHLPHQQVTRNKAVSEHNSACFSNGTVS